MVGAVDDPAHEGFECKDRREQYLSRAKDVCSKYLRDFYAPSTRLIYRKKLNGPHGYDVLEKPENIDKGISRGNRVPWGYGSGIEDVNLFGGQLLYALCEAYDCSEDDYLGEVGKYIFSGLRLVGTISKSEGFIPRGPHPNGKSYYKDTSRDQVSAHLYGIWRYYRSKLANEEEKEFVRQAMGKVLRRIERDNWTLTRENGNVQCKVGESWLRKETRTALTLLASLAMTYDVTREGHWLELFEFYAKSRWKYLNPEDAFTFSGHPLYTYQNLYKFEALETVLKELEKPEWPIVHSAKEAFAKALISSRWPLVGKSKWTEETLSVLGWKDFVRDPFDGWSRFDPSRLKMESIRKSKKAYTLYITSCLRFPWSAIVGGIFSKDSDILVRIVPMAEAMFRTVDYDRIGSGELRLFPVLYCLHLLSICS